MADLVAPTSSIGSKPRIGSPVLLPADLHFKLTDDGHLVLSDEGNADAHLVVVGETQAITDDAGSGRRFARVGNRIIGY